MIGQDPQRYGGLGYGNVSRRLESSGQEGAFVISGTQTGALEHLAAHHYCIVQEAWPEENGIVAEGPVKPSSEALTHAAVYAADASIHSVIHVHCPEIWACSQTLQIPAVSARIAYGTPAMAAAVRLLFRSGTLREKFLFSMLGHADGLVSFGMTVEEAAQSLIKHLALALRLSL